eukprot:1732636-Rhodomonas_salina.1
MKGRELGCVTGHKHLVSCHVSSPPLLLSRPSTSVAQVCKTEPGRVGRGAWTAREGLGGRQPQESTLTRRCSV